MGLLVVTATQLRMLRELRALVEAAIERLDPDDLMAATPGSVAESLDRGDVMDAVSDWLEELATVPLVDARRELRCDECGGETAPAHRDPADEERRCIDDRCEGWAAW